MMGALRPALSVAFRRSTRMTRRCLLLFCALLLPAVALADRFPAQPHIYVTGEAVEKLPPDFVETAFMVARTGADVVATRTEVDAITERVWKAAQQVGIARADFEATGFSINPMYDYQDGRRQYRGTQVSRQFKARLRDTARFNAWTEALVAAGVQDVPGVSVNVDRREAREAALRAIALQNARTEAQRLATALDQVITGVHTISDTPIGEGGGVHFRMAELKSAAMEAPTLPDTVELRVQAYAVFTMMAK
jgi:uncharacterized protein